MGLVRNVEIFNKKIKLTMILTTPYCPYGPIIMESTRKNAEDAAGIPAEIIYGTDVWDATMMEDGTGFDWGLF